MNPDPWTEVPSKSKRSSWFGCTRSVGGVGLVKGDSLITRGGEEENIGG